MNGGTVAELKAYVINAGIQIPKPMYLMRRSDWLALKSASPPAPPTPVAKKVSKPKKPKIKKFKDIQKEIFPGLGIFHYPKVLKDTDIARFTVDLDNLSGFAQKPVVVYGKSLLQPRQTVSFSDKGLAYKYSGTTCTGAPFDGFMDELRGLVEEIVGTKFNFCLINKYRDGNDSIGAHSDDEKGMSGPIASMSFGATRFFDVTSKCGEFEKIRTPLEAGSLIVMHPGSQKASQHAVPVQKRVKGIRYNLTFRNIDG
jgi:alkylated DNA repair dioxygenase AlkB